MNGSEVAKRYAKALFDTADSSEVQTLYYKELKEFKKILQKDPAIDEFIHSVLVMPEQKEQVIAKSLESCGLSKEVESFLRLLAIRGRLKIFEEILSAYQYFVDENNGVTRGVVRSSMILSGPGA